MEKPSFKLAFLVVLLVTASCLALRGEAIRVQNCDDNCKATASSQGSSTISANDNNQNVATYEPNKAARCVRDADCKKYCPPKCRIVNCISGTCFCEC